MRVCTALGQLFGKLDMRILHILSYTTPEAGGSVLLGLDQTRRLAERGHDVAIYTTNRRYPRGIEQVPLDRPVQRNGVHLLYFPVEFPPMLVSRRLANALSQDIGSFDIVHCHGIYRFPQIAAGYFARRAGVPYIVRPHGSLDPFVYNQKERKMFKRLFERLFMYKYLNGAAALHFTDREEHERVKFLGLTSPPVIIPNGIDTGIYARDDLKGCFREEYGLENRPIILHLGRLSKQKGLDLLVPAFARLRCEQPDAVLVLAGPDNDGFKASLDRWIAAAGIGDSVRFTGMLRGDAKLAALIDADVFVAPSYFENFGTTVVEAMAAGTPVIVSDQVYIWRDIVEPGGGSVTPCDAEALAAALIDLLADDERRARMAERSVDIARTRFDWDTVIPRLEETYRGLARKIHQGRAL